MGGGICAQRAIYRIPPKFLTYMHSRFQDIWLRPFMFKGRIAALPLTSMEEEYGVKKIAYTTKRQLRIASPERTVLSEILVTNKS